MNYDIIGDIHGHAAALRALLASLGYSEEEQAALIQVDVPGVVQ